MSMSMNRDRSSCYFVGKLQDTQINPKNSYIYLYESWATYNKIGTGPDTARSLQKVKRNPSYTNHI